MDFFVMLKVTSSKLIKRRTLKELLFKNICIFTTSIYIVLISAFLFVIVKAGMDAFRVTKVKVNNVDELELVQNIISNSISNTQKIELIHEGKGGIWLDTKGQFSVYYKKNERYNKRFNRIIQNLTSKNSIKVFNSFSIITQSDSSYQERAGLLGAIKGTLMLVAIFLTFSSVIGIATGIYLTEFAKNQKLKNFINLNISNLASIPPIIYGIFGINFLINVLHIPRSSSLLGGLIIGLLTLPIIVIITSDSLKSVPSHLKFSAKALGLTDMQTVFRVCVPYAFPRMLTGILLTLSRGINEATPLILIGMASFIQSPPINFTDPATTIATQIYLWIINPDESFTEKAFGSIFILLIIVGSINLFASLIRYKIMKKNTLR